MKKALIPGLLCTISLTFFSPQPAAAWTDQTHMAIGCAAEFKGFHNDCAPDVSHTVAILNRLQKTDSQAHFFDASRPITVKDVYDQLEQIGQQRSDGNEGYLLGEIVNATRKTKERTEAGKFDDYNYAVLCHYVGDLSMPLHMAEYDDFNKKNHLKIDSILDRKDVKYDVEGAFLIAKELKVDNSVTYKTEDDVVNAVVALANKSHDLALKIRAENRLVTHEEAIAQASESATMFKALMKYCGKIK